MKQINTYCDLINYRNKIIECYYSIYQDYKLLIPVSLNSKEDITLDFVNCTICEAKKNISKNIVGDNYIVTQPCLRNNHIDDLKNKDTKPYYMSYFTMIGGFCYINKEDDWVDIFNDIVIKQFEFFKTLYSNNFMRLTIPIQYREFLRLSQKTAERLLNNNC